MVEYAETLDLATEEQLKDDLGIDNLFITDIIDSSTNIEGYESMKDVVYLVFDRKYEKELQQYIKLGSLKDNFPKHGLLSVYGCTQAFMSRDIKYVLQNGGKEPIIIEAKLNANRVMRLYNIRRREKKNFLDTYISSINKKGLQLKGIGDLINGIRIVSYDVPDAYIIEMKCGKVLGELPIYDVNSEMYLIENFDIIHSMRVIDMK